MYSLGIDTSNYKTSIAVVDDDNNLIFERSEFLDVPDGELGLRQSTAFFKHSNRLPEFLDELFFNIDINNVKSIGVSSKPRRVEGSYMPCFLAGINTARTLSTSNSIPLYEFSHQEGHLAAVIDTTISEPFIFFHISGGTTEFLLCQKDELGYKTTKVGGTKDISAGQLIDRIGVSLGYSFPAGKFIDEIAFNHVYDNSLLPGIKLDDNEFNLSGIETKILRYINTAPKNDVDTMVSTMMYRISQLLFQSTLDLSNKHCINNVYVAGGVASSATIKSHILSFKEEASSKGLIPHDLNIIFGEAKLCGDNAIGIAKLANNT